MNSHQRIRSLLVAVIITAVTGTSLFADETNNPPPETNAVPASTIDQRLNELEQEINNLKSERERDQVQAQQNAALAAQTAQKVNSAPFITAGPDGFRFKTADSNFVMRVGGYAQADGRFYLNDGAGNGVDTFLMRRVRLIAEGSLYHDFDYRIMTDFGNGASSSTLLQDAYVEWHHWQEVKLRVGKFKPPTGLEWLASDTDLLFIERGLPTDLVPQRDIGAQVSGNLLNGAATYAFGVFNGVVDGGIGDLDTTDAKDLAARVFFVPFKTTDIEALQGLGVGVAGTIGHEAANSTTTNLPSYKTVGQLTFFNYSKGVAPDGQGVRYDPQAYYNIGPFGILGEYNVSDLNVSTATSHADINNTAWQIAGGFFLTGEKQKYRGSPYSPSGAVSPIHPFKLGSGGWGAFELVARYGDLSIDHNAFNKNPSAAGTRFASPITNAQEARDWGVGVNWYLNKNIKISLDFDYTTFSGGAGSASATAYTIKDRQAEQDLFTQAQFTF